MEHCMNAGADFVMRVRSKAFKMYDADGNTIQRTDLLCTVTEAPTDFSVYYKCPDQSLHSVRLCAVQKSDEEQAYAQKKLRQKERKRQMKISEDTKYSHNYFFVVTSLDEHFSAEEIMTIYRLRWQVEMVFKRLKSVIGLGSMPTKTAESSEAWLNCKMLIALLIEKMLSSVDFPPVENVRSMWREMKTLYHLILACFLNVNEFDFQADFRSIALNCCVEKRKSGVRMQMSALSLG